MENLARQARETAARFNRMAQLAREAAEYHEKRARELEEKAKAFEAPPVKTPSMWGYTYHASHNYDFRY